MSLSTGRKAYVFILNHAPSIRDITVTYADGRSDSGFVKNADGNDEHLILERRIDMGSVNQVFKLDFGRATRVDVELADGEVETFT